MSGTARPVFQPTPGVYARLREKYIHGRYSTAVTRLYAYIGLTDRQKLSDYLKALPRKPNPISLTSSGPLPARIPAFEQGYHSDNQGLMLEALVAAGILKSKFRPTISLISEVEPYMLEACRQETVHKLGTGIVGHYYTTIGQVAPPTPATPAAATEQQHSAAFTWLKNKGAKYGLAIMAVIGSTWFVGDLPQFSSYSPFDWFKVISAGMTVTCLLATKYSTAYPKQGPYKYAGKAASFLARRVGPLFYLADAGLIGGAIYQANLNIFNLLEHDLTVTLTYLGVLGTTIKAWVWKNRAEFEKSFPGQIDPGVKKVMARDVDTASNSVASEAHYIGTRTLLWGAASAYLAVNSFTHSVASLIPLAAPIIGLAASYRLHKQPTVFFKLHETDAHKEAEKLDERRIYSPLYGLLGGVLLAGVASLGTWSLIPLLAYTTFYATFLNLFPNEYHQIYHSIGTTLDWINLHMASAKDIVSLEEREDALAGHWEQDPYGRLIQKNNIQMIGINPGTNVTELTDGQTFNVHVNRVEGFTIVTNYDRVALQAGNRDVYRSLKAFHHFVVRPQQRVLRDILVQRLKDETSSNYGDGNDYEQLAENLSALAKHLESDSVSQRITEELTGKKRNALKPDVFMPHDEMAEVRRAIREQLSIRGEELRDSARKLRRIVSMGATDRDEFSRYHTHFVKVYDPRFIAIIPFARKSTPGDDALQRKVESVTPINSFFGITSYVGRAKATEAPTLASQTPANPLPHDYEETIGATWSAVSNPYFRAGAKSGLAAATHVYVKTQHRMTDAQKEEAQRQRTLEARDNPGFSRPPHLRDIISQSTEIAGVDNNPALDAAFCPGTEPITLDCLGKQVTFAPGDYYFSETPDRIPEVQEVFMRPGESLRDGYRLALNNELRIELNNDGTRAIGPAYRPDPAVNPNDIDAYPLAFTIPMFDLTDMVDKNDIIVYPDKLAAILARSARLHCKANLIVRVPVPGQGEHHLTNPFPNKSIDVNKGFHIVDAATELKYKDNAGIERTIPWLISRDFNVFSYAAQLAGTAQLNNLVEVELQMMGGEPLSMTLIYHNVKDNNGNLQSVYRLPVPNYFIPEFWRSLNLPTNEPKVTLEANLFRFPDRDGDASWVMWHYTDETQGFALLPYGQRPPLVNYDRRVCSDPNNWQPTYYNVDISTDNKNIRLSNIQMPLGLSLPIARGWDRGGETNTPWRFNMEEAWQPQDRTYNVAELLTAGNLYINGSGELTPIPPYAGASNYSGQMVGMAYAYDQNGQQVGRPMAVPLGNYVVLNREDR